MNDVRDFFNAHFFVIDKENCSDIQPKFYGYAFYDNLFYINEHQNSLIPSDAIGAYINIYKNDNNIIIQQDYWGSYGIFYYHSNDYWAISNSFFWLFIYLKEKNYKLNLNEQYLKYFVRENFVSVSVSKTPISEIIQIQKDMIINIDISKKFIKFEMQSRNNEWKYDINSEDGMMIIDKWHHKWNSLAKKLIDENYVSIDLSGGFDSRAAFSIFKNSNLDLNKNSVKVYSIIDPKAGYPEDFEIANKISNVYGFTLNNKNFNPEKLQLDENMSLLISLTRKMMFHLYYFQTTFYKNYIFCFGGSGGESRRGQLWATIQEDELIRGFIWSLNNKIPIQDNCIKDIIYDSYSEIKKLPYYNDEITASALLYAHTIIRVHFSRSEEHLANVIRLSPLLDPSLRQLKLKNDFCDDRNLLFAIIYCRFLPELSQIEISENRKINENTMIKAMELCKLYPLYDKNDDYNNISIVSKYITQNIKNSCQDNNIREIFPSLVSSKVVKYINKYRFYSNFDKIWKDARQRIGMHYWDKDSLPFTLNSISILERINNGYIFNINNIFDLFEYKITDRDMKKMLQYMILGELKYIWAKIKQTRKNYSYTIRQRLKKWRQLSK
ncbi:MAG: hypothetical protein J1E80_03820 [Desulfovibrionaceae bacterium]|nr:hypothetical protein [Desulfovibrionaceae bacterium]